MASLRRNKALLPDSLTARFLYAIIKQLDLKSIDWSLVAESLEITNGHAARMRYTRFKTQIEGNSTQPKTPKASGRKKEKVSKGGFEEPTRGRKRSLEMDDAVGKEDVGFSPLVFKTEDADQPMVKKRARYQNVTRVKGESEEHRSSNTAEAQFRVKVEAIDSSNSAKPGTAMPLEAQPRFCPSQIKREPDEDDSDTPNNPDIWRMLPPQSSVASTSSYRFPSEDLRYCYEPRTPYESPTLPVFAPAAATHNRHQRNQHHQPSSREYYCQPRTQPETVNPLDLEISPKSQYSMPTTTSTAAASTSSSFAPTTNPSLPAMRRNAEGDYWF